MGNLLKNKTGLKRVFSLIMTFVMIFGMVPIPSFALPAGVSIINPGSDAQTSLPSSLSDGQIWTDKSVNYLGSSNPSDPLNGQFEIKFRATGQNYKQLQPAVKFDVILALDYSYSMGSGSNSKLKKQETAAIQIAKDLIDAGNRVAVLKYNDKAEMQIKHGTFMTNKSQAEDVIDDGYSGTYTNIQNAFLVAQGAFSSRSTSEKVNKPVLILISDGEPTIYHDSLTSHTNQNKHQSINSGGSYVWYTIQQGMKLKKSEDGVVSNDDVAIYTIGFDLLNNTIATATLQPTAANTASYRPANTPFDHTYWVDSFIIGNGASEIEAALAAISQNYTSSKPMNYDTVAGYSDIVISDVLGSGFEVVGSLPSGVTESGGTVTWTIDGDTFNTLPAESTSLTSAGVTEVTFKVKIKNSAAINTTHYTNSAAKAQFKVQSDNPFYNTTDIENTLSNKGWLTLTAPDTQATITVNKTVTGPVTSTGRTFSFSLYDSPSNGNLVAGPISITVNGAQSNSNTFNFSIPYNGFNGNNQATFYIQEDNSVVPSYWTYDNSARKAVTISRSNPTGSKTFTNSYAPKGSLTVKKDWTGSGPSGTGPKGDVTFDLYKMGSSGWELVSTGHTITNGNTNGITIEDLALDTQYKVEETSVNDYLTHYSVAYVEFNTAAVIAGSANALEKTITITNDYQTPIGKITITKEWNDDNDAAGDRPDDITFSITGPLGYNGPSSITLSEAGGWSKTFETYTFGDYVFTEEVPLDYTIAAEDLAQTASISMQDREDALTFTNTYVEPKGELTVTKDWANENNTDFRPATITLNLLLNGEATAYTVDLPENDSTPWTHTFTDLPFGVYTVEEIQVADYTPSYSSPVTLSKFDDAGGITDRTGQLTVTNTFDDPRGSITVTKTWVEGGVDENVVRPASIVVDLLKDGVGVDSYELNDGNNWSHEFTGLELDNSTYTVQESSTDSEMLSMYSKHVSYSGTGASESGILLSPSARSGNIALVNTYAKGTITVTKTWNDGENPVDERPTQAVITLHKVTAATEAIPPIPGIPEVPATDENPGSPEIPGVPGVPAMPETDEVVGTMTISKPLNTPVVFYNLELGDNISYYVTEAAIDFYSQSISDSSIILNENHQNHIVNVTNTYTDPKGNLIVNKTWDHRYNPNQATEVTVKLYEDGLYKTEATFSSSYTFTGLTLGKTYTVVENDVYSYNVDYHGFDGYKPMKQGGEVPSGNVNLTNTYEPELGNLKVTKEWVGNTGNPITVTLRRSFGEVVDQAFVETTTLNSENEWMHMFNDLPIYGPGGVKYVYAVQEQGSDLSLYDTDTSDTATLNVETPASIVITNTYAPEKGSLTITKAWIGLDEEPIDAPVESIQVRLIVDGVPEEGTMLLNDENNWTVLRSELNVEKTYAVVEVSQLEEFDVSYSASAITFDAQNLEKEVTIYNYRTPDEPSIDVNKSLSNALVQLAGGTATFNYTVELINNGNRTLENLSVLDKMSGPAGATMTYNPAPTSSSAEGSLFELEGTLAPGESRLFNYSVTVNLAGTFTNVATGTGYYVETEVSDTDGATGVATNPPVTTTEPSNPTEPTDPDSPQGVVNVTFVDTNGTTLSPGFQMVGDVGSNYVTSARDIIGFVLTETPENASGSFINGSTSVVYVYDVETETITEPEVPLGEATTEPTSETTVEEVLLPEEETPLGGALPQTGQLPTELFYGFGSLITAAGIYLKKRKF
ncbi:Cna B-type domain-containing protein [Fusibacter bizertensis]